MIKIFLDVDKSNENDIESNSDKNIGYLDGYVVLAKNHSVGFVYNSQKI